MSDLSMIEKRKLEKAFGMETSYVLNFSDQTFSDLFLDVIGVDIYDDKYSCNGNSKANRMRAFWSNESNFRVGKILVSILQEWDEFKDDHSPKDAPIECWKIAQRLQKSAPIKDIDEIASDFNDNSFDTLAKSIRECIDKNEPKVGLDRLHTFLIKYFRVPSQQRGIEANKDKPLHSLLGEYKVVEK